VLHSNAKQRYRWRGNQRHIQPTHSGASDGGSSQRTRSGICDASLRVLRPHWRNQHWRVSVTDKASAARTYFVYSLIAIMLGRLRMTVEECIQEYRTLAEEAFTPKKKAILPARPRGAFSATALEHAVKSTCKRYCTVSECVQQRQHGIDHLTNCSHEDLEFSDERCTKTYVCAVFSELNAEY
jgi:hypothetical protein